MANKPNRYYQGPPSDHYDGERFFMPGHRMANGLRELVRWQRAGGRQTWPRQVENVPQAAPPDAIGQGDMQVTYIGHATVLIQIAGLNVLTDPSFRGAPARCSGPARSGYIRRA